MPREILVDWITPAGGGRVSVFMFTGGNPVADQRSALNDFLVEASTSLTDGVSWDIRLEGRNMDDATGALTSLWSEPTVYGGTGDQAGQPVPDAAQVLYRWGTGEIVNGRFLQGRTYVPGFYVTGLSAGNLSAGTVAGQGANAQALVDAAVGLGVWHRPVLGAGGVFHDAITGSVWSELAVLRRRRS